MNKARNIFLVGPMGAGKTTVGKQLAKQLGMEFFDVDREIERRTGADVSWIFEKEGEHGFRCRETQAIDELTARHGIVLATGGGSVLKEENRRLLRRRGTVVFLRTSVERQLQRLSMDKNRPLLQTKDRESKLRALASNRNDVYEELADLAIESDGRSVYAMAKLVQNKIDDVFASF